MTKNTKIQFKLTNKLCQLLNIKRNGKKPKHNLSNRYSFVYRPNGMAGVEI